MSDSNETVEIDEKIAELMPVLPPSTKGRCQRLVSFSLFAHRLAVYFIIYFISWMHVSQSHTLRIFQRNHHGIRERNGLCGFSIDLRWTWKILINHVKVKSSKNVRALWLIYGMQFCQSIVPTTWSVDVHVRSQIVGGAYKLTIYQMRKEHEKKRNSLGHAFGNYYRAVSRSRHFNVMPSRIR